jgi:hypothetical protein
LAGLGDFAAAAAPASGERKQFPMANQPSKLASASPFFFFLAHSHVRARDLVLAVRVDDALVLV